MYQNARLVYHGEVQRTPVLEKREVLHLVVEGEVIVLRVIVGRRGRARLRLTAYGGFIIEPICRFIEAVGLGRRALEGREVQPS